MTVMKATLGARQLALFGSRSMQSTAAQIKLNVSDDQSIAVSRPFSEVPRPGKLKFLRAFLPGGELKNQSFMEFTNSMRKTYGDVFIIPGAFGRKDLVATFNPKDIEMVFRNEGIWPHREGFDSMVYYRENIRKDIYGDAKGLLASQGKDWGSFRSAVNPIFMQPKGLKMYYEPLSNIYNEFIERIKEIRDPKTMEVPADFSEEIARMVFESIGLIAFNREMGIIRKRRDNPDALQLFKITREITNLIFELDMQPSMWKIVSTPKYREMVRYLDESLDISQRMISESWSELQKKQQSGEKLANVSIMEKLMEFDPKLALVMGMDILFGGVDATSILISALLLCLSKNPEKQHKLREELFRVMPTKETLLNEESMKDMPYLRAVIKETLRYYPNGFGTFRQCQTDVTLSGYTIPKGTNVLLASHAMMNDENYFHRADEFLPERWLRDPETKKKEQVNPFSFLPFGFGPRMCIGKRIVDLETETSVAKIIRNFYVEFNHDASKPFTSYVFLVPAIPFKFKFTDVEK